MRVAERAGALERLLREKLQPAVLAVRDDSHLHEGHVSAGGAGHFHVLIAADCFAGLSRVARHRLVFEAASELMGAEIHALSIDARVPEAGDAG